MVYSVFNGNENKSENLSKLRNDFAALWRRATDKREASLCCEAGQIAEELDEWKYAEECYKEALKYDPGCADAMECLGSLFLTRNDGDAAQELIIARDWFIRRLKFGELSRHVNIKLRFSASRRQAV